MRVTYSNLILATPTPGTTRQAAPLPSGTSYDSHFDVDVLQPSTACAGCRYADPGPNITIAPVAGVHSGAIMSIRYGGNRTQLVRPFIVVEGFNRSRVAPATASNYNVEEFLADIRVNNGFDFRDALDNIGEYDLVFVDFNYGTDDILRNARAFEEVLDRVEQLKVVNPATGQREDNVVMGMSMGGLISRYKLAEMTKAGRPTHTRLLVLQDSPQRGANIPLGIQAAVRQADFSFDGFTLADVLPALRQVLQLLDEPATRQLLVHRATTATGGFQANTFLDGTYQPMIRFAASAPQPGYRVVAVSQGSQCGRDLFAPYTELVRADGRVFASPMPWIRRTSYETSVVINALPSGGQARRVSYMSLKKRVRLFGFITTTTTTSSANYTCPGGLLAWDGVPGGTVPIASTTATRLSMHAPRQEGRLEISYEVDEDDCGNALGATASVLVLRPTGSGGGTTAALYPNPARETVEVQVAAPSVAQPVTVRLFDTHGQARAEQTSTGQPTVRLSTAALPAGLYFVHILRGAEVLSRQQLRVEK